MPGIKSTLDRNQLIQVDREATAAKLRSEERRLIKARLQLGLRNRAVNNAGRLTVEKQNIADVPAGLGGRLYGAAFSFL